jgi:signal transduction histidine kinase
MTDMTEEVEVERPSRVGSLLQSAYGSFGDANVWRAVLYNLLGGPIAWTAAFVIVMTVVISVGFIPLMLLLPPAALLLVRRAGGLERARARAFLGIHVDAPAPRVRAEGFLQWVQLAITDAIAWRALGYFVVLFGLGNLTFFATIGVGSAAVTQLSVPFWAGPTDFPKVLIFFGGLVVLALFPRVVMALAQLNGRLVGALLGPAPEAKIKELEGQRSSAVRVADVDRRRIEQDLHDGAQVRLTALALQIGLAREAVSEGADTERVSELLDEAHSQAKQALREIRDLARGIHPAILTDRGLSDALISMVGRLPVPIDLDVDISERPSPEVESIVYFVAAEAVTNAVRHSDSPTVGLRVVRSGDEITLEVRDRGRGGADPEQGTGLASLRERVEATGGRMTVESPEGVGTLVRAVVPCN